MFDEMDLISVKFHRDFCCVLIRLQWAHRQTEAYCLRRETQLLHYIEMFIFNGRFIYAGYSHEWTQTNTHTKTQALKSSLYLQRCGL